jgi:hypothetical protein
MITKNQLDQFIDEVLSLPSDVRSNLFKIAEKNYTGIPYGTKDIYTYLYWRCKMVPRDHNAALDLSTHS